MIPSLTRLRWYKSRLKAMSAAEIFYRLSTKIRQRRDRADARQWIAPLRDTGPLPEIPGLRAGIEKGVLPDTLLDQWTQDAARAHNGSLTFFGQTEQSGSRDTRWHFDPVSKTSWPRDIFCFAIDYRHAPHYGDIKYVWELNRLQYLQPLAALACKRKDAALAKFCLSEIESWIDNNPPFLGVNWSSGIELALRVISILTVTTLTSEHLSRTLRGKIWSSLQTHGRWLARYPSRYSSANNHRTAEALGLFIIGALCPHFAEAEQWKHVGFTILCEAAEHQILPDGAGAEQAVGYAAAVLETLLTGWIIAQNCHIPVPPFYLRKLTLAGEYLRWLSDAKGNLPHIGDDDNACVFGAYHRDDLYIPSVLGCLAATMGRPDLSPPNTPPHLRQAIFGVAPAPDFTPYGVRTFPHGGMTIGRHASARGDILLALDHGPLGYLSIAAHGHADTLAVWLHIDGQPIFVDAGTYLYHSQNHERRFFRSTAAHNTLMIEDVEASLMAGNFNWSRKAQGVLRSFSSDGSFWQADVEQDGYRGPFQTLHRRRLNVSPASGAVIEDSLIGPSPRAATIRFLLHPDLTARQEGQEILILKGEQLFLRMRHEGGLAPLIGLANTPEGGWYSSEFGTKQATAQILFQGILSPHQKAETHLFWSA